MASTVRATFGYADNQMPYVRGADFTNPVMRGRDAVGLTELTTGGTAGNVQSGGGDFVSSAFGYATIRNDGGAIWVSIGTAPTAAVGADFFIADGERLDFALIPGDKISAIDDS